MTKAHFIKLSSRATRLSRSGGTTEESRDLLFLPNMKIIAAALLSPRALRLQSRPQLQASHAERSRPVSRRRA